ncbi:MAG: protein-L-isoaspartate(D-aspartate) O-methyltransferase [Terriglobia bacterium]
MMRRVAGCLMLGLLALGSDPYQAMREKMVEYQIEMRGVKDPAVLRAMREVPRHLFLPATQKDYAYDDSPLPIGYGQTISQPYIVAYMTEVLHLQKGDRVLEIGTGSGYQGAVLAEIVKEVYTVEIVPELGKKAIERFAALGYKNVTVKIGDGYEGWKEHAPFDGIMVTAGAESIPPPLTEQLNDGGRLVIPVGSPDLVQNLILLEKHGKEIVTQKLIPVRFVPFRRGQ